MIDLCFAAQGVLPENRARQVTVFINGIYRAPLVELRVK